MPYFTIIGRYTPEYGWVKFAVLTLFVPFNDIQKAAKLVFFSGKGVQDWPRFGKLKANVLRFGQGTRLICLGQCMSAYDLT
jgi:hypothetical protein